MMKQGGKSESYDKFSYFIDTMSMGEKVNLDRWVDQSPIKKLICFSDTTWYQ